MGGPRRLLDLMGHAVLHDVARGCAYSAEEVRELATYRLSGEVMGAIVGGSSAKQDE